MTSKGGPKRSQIEQKKRPWPGPWVLLGPLWPLASLRCGMKLGFHPDQVIIGCVPWEGGATSRGKMLLASPACLRLRFDLLHRRWRPFRRSAGLLRRCALLIVAEVGAVHRQKLYTQTPDPPHYLMRPAGNYGQQFPGLESRLVIMDNSFQALSAA